MGHTMGPDTNEIARHLMYLGYLEPSPNYTPCKETPCRIRGCQEPIQQDQRFQRALENMYKLWQHGSPKFFDQWGGADRTLSQETFIDSVVNCTCNPFIFGTEIVGKEEKAAIHKYIPSLPRDLEILAKERSLDIGEVLVYIAVHIKERMVQEGKLAWTNYGLVQSEARRDAA